MRKSLKLALGATLAAATQLASAGIATVEVSDLRLTGTSWYWLPHDQTWLAPTANTATGMDNPALTDENGGWHGMAYGAGVQDGGSSAEAGMTAATGNNMIDGITARADVVADGGASAWAFAQVFSGQILVPQAGTITLTASIAELFAEGDMAQANLFIEFCSTDFVTDTCEAANYAEAFIDGTSGPYGGPMTITASWTAPTVPGSTDAVWAKMRIGLSASAETDIARTVPEPASITMLLTGLGLLGLARRRSRSR